MYEIIELLKKEVRWTFVYNDGRSEEVFEQETALAILLLTSNVFLNNHWWMEEEGWSKEAAAKTISLNLNTSDVLAWGCADAHTLQHKEIKDVYDHWEKDPIYGTAVWYCKKMNMMPQPPLAERIRAQGIWNIDNMGLQSNPADVQTCPTCGAPDGGTSCGLPDCGLILGGHNED
jgi:hypothetical protein